MFLANTIGFLLLGGIWCAKLERTACAALAAPLLDDMGQLVYDGLAPGTGSRRENTILEENVFPYRKGARADGAAEVVGNCIGVNTHIIEVAAQFLRGF